MSEQILMPTEEEKNSAIDKVLCGLSFLTKSPTSNKIPANYNNLNAVNDLVDGLDVLQNAVPGYDITFVRTYKSNWMQKAKSLAQIMKLGADFKKIFS